MSTTTTTTIGAEPFMNYLAELQTKYFERINQELVTYFATEPVATLTRRFSSHVSPPGESITEAFASLKPLLSALEAMPPHRFSDGVKVDMADYLRYPNKKWQLLNAENFDFRITLLRARKRVDKTLLVKIKGDRFGLGPKWSPWTFSESFSVPLRFYDFLRDDVFVDSEWHGYPYFKDCVHRQLARTGEELCVFDRAVKLKALRQLLAA